MIKIEAIVRPEKMEDVKDALATVDVHGITCIRLWAAVPSGAIAKRSADVRYI